MRPLLRAGSAGVATGVVCGLAVLGIAGAAVRSELVPPERDPATLIEATHLPPLLTTPGEAVTLRYDIYCAPPGSDPESGAPCDAGGTVYVRPGESGPYRPLPLRLDAGAGEGRYRADVPVDVAGATSGFSYYAVLRSNTTGATTALPAGGAAAPMRSRPLAHVVRVALARHRFGATRPATARVATARWGHGDGEAGLEQGPELGPIGGSSFAVDANGAVDILDEANRRVLRFAKGAARAQEVPLAVRGTIADLGVGDDGTLAVLETVGDDGKTPVLKSFDDNGRTLGQWHLAEHDGSALRVDAAGPQVLEYPPGQWMPLTDRGRGLSQGEQRARGHVGRSLPGGDELVVEREGTDARIAEVGPGGVRRSWQITSDTPLGEVQLAEPFGGGVLAVLRVYTDTQDEFEALLLDAKGLVQRFALPSTAWAETAALARFRLRGSSLYELGSTPAGVFVDRYDLEVTR